MAGFFGLFDYTKPGKGVSKEDLEKTGISLYFDILGRRLGKIVILNILFLITSIPAIAISAFLSPVLLAYLQSFSGSEISADAISVMYIFLISVMILFTGTGSASAAMSYVLRKYVNDTHSWAWTDFIDNLKSNFLQGTVAYIINTVAFCVISFAAMYYYFYVKGPMSILFTAVIIIISLVFLLMQMYLYQIMASVKLKIKDIYRNALLLALGRLPVSIAAFAVTAMFVYLLNLIVVNAIVMAVLFLIFYSINNIFNVISNSCF